MSKTEPLSVVPKGKILLPYEPELRGVDKVSSGYKVATQIESNRNGQSILFCPIESGGVTFGKYVEDAMKMLAVPYRRLPFEVNGDRQKILSPTRTEISEEILKLKDEYKKDVIAVPFDDTVLGGRRLLTLYGFLKDNQDYLGINDIPIATFIEDRGIVDYVGAEGFRAKIRENKDEALKRFRSTRKTPAKRMGAYFYEIFAYLKRREDKLGRALML
ncbi:MAG TPA: hypothetical protein VJI12_01290 [archaeon]|nr:hypothetical protein [archaeon]